MGYLNSDQAKNRAVLEFNTSELANSGVFVRSPKEAGGYEVQIWKQQPAGYNTGSIVGTAKTARDFAFKPNQWNQLQITADGDHLVVVMNGETTLDVHDAKFPDGNIRLQYQQYPISFRNIKVRALRERLASITICRSRTYSHNPRFSLQILEVLLCISYCSA